MILTLRFSRKTVPSVSYNPPTKLANDSLLYLMKENLLDLSLIKYNDIVRSKHGNNLDVLEFMIKNYDLKSGHIIFLFNKLKINSL